MNRHLVFLPFVACTAGCVVWTDSTVDIEGEDENVVFPLARASWELIPNTRGEEMEAVEGTLTLDLEAAYTEADFNQNLSSGRSINFDHVEFPGPSRVAGDADLITASASVRGGMMILEQLRLEGILGVGLSHMDLELESGATRERDINTAVGPLFGARFTWQPLTAAGLYAQGTVLAGVEHTSVAVGEVGIVLTPIRPVSIVGGWRWLGYREDRSRSDVDLDLSGPIVGLQVTF